MRLISLKSDTGICITPVAIEDAEALALLVQQNVEHLCAYLPMLRDLASIDSANRHLIAAVERASAGEVFEWHLFVDGILCGAIRLKDIDSEERKAKIGYFIGRKYAGKGIVTSTCSFARRIDPLRLTRLPLPGKRCNAVV